MFNIFKKKPAQEPTKYVVVAESVAAYDFHKQFSAVGVRFGMWVTSQQGVGVVKGVSLQDNTLTVGLANPDGTNRLDVVVPVSEVKQAFYEEIPAPRRAGLPKERAQRMGYL